MTPPTPPPAPDVEDGAEAVVTDHLLDAAPDRVWRALSEPHLVSEWLGPNDLRAEPGARFQVVPDPSGGPVACEVIEADPPRRLAFSWREPGAPDAVVAFELTPAEGGRTHLRVVHRAAEARPARGPTVMIAGRRPVRRGPPTMRLAA